MTHVDLLDLVGGDARALDGRLDGDGAELDGREALEVAREVADRRPGGRGDKDLLRGEGGLKGRARGRRTNGLFGTRACVRARERNDRSGQPTDGWNKERPYVGRGGEATYHGERADEHETTTREGRAGEEERGGGQGLEQHQERVLKTAGLGREAAGLPVWAREMGRRRRTRWDEAAAAAAAVAGEEGTLDSYLLER